MHVAVPSEIETLFRRESRRLISVLTRILGPGNLELAEDVLQDAFIAAMREWTSRGVPGNPSAWLLTAARNRAIDAIRRERTRRTFAADLAMYLDSEWTLARTVDEAFGENWIKDDQLRIFPPARSRSCASSVVMRCSSLVSWSTSRHSPTARPSRSSR